jgi:hypothetical protein
MASRLLPLRFCLPVVEHEIVVCKLAGDSECESLPVDCGVIDDCAPTDRTPRDCDRLVVDNIVDDLVVIQDSNRIRTGSRPLDDEHLVGLGADVLRPKRWAVNTGNCISGEHVYDIHSCATSRLCESLSRHVDTSVDMTDSDRPLNPPITTRAWSSRSTAREIRGRTNGPGSFYSSLSTV